MRVIGIAAVLTLSVSCFGQQSDSAAAMPQAKAPAASESAIGMLSPLTPEDKVKRRALRLIEPVTLLSSAFSAGIDQWRDTPHAWKEGAQGYAIRFASEEGYTAAHNAIALGFDLALHLDPRYRRMPGAAFHTRLWNAVSQTVVANKDSGGKTLNVSEIGGNLGAGFISNTWLPAGYNSPSDGLTRGMLGLLFHTGKNVVREFLPDLLHRNQSTVASASPHS